MIDIRSEMIVTLRTAARRLPRRRRGRRTHVSTLHRWARRGLGGVRLETLKVGGATCTSVEALQRFFDRLSGGTEAQQRSATPTADNVRTARQLDRIGI